MPSIKSGREPGFNCKQCGRRTNPDPTPKDKLCWWCKNGIEVKGKK